MYQQLRKLIKSRPTAKSDDRKVLLCNTDSDYYGDQMCVCVKQEKE